MNKILVVSDSHGLKEELVKIKEKHSNELNLMIHCGDSELEMNDPAIENFATVRGNCDFVGKFPEEIIKTISNKKIYITHGHKYNVKSTLMNISFRAREVGADIVCFGHSHLLGAELIDGVLYLNPGSIRLPRLRKEKTYVILELSYDKVVLNVYDINHGLLPDLTKDFIIHS